MSKDADTRNGRFLIFRGMSQRNQRGSELIEGAVGLLLIVMVMVGGFLLIFCVCAVLNYKIKLAVVTTQVAAYASSLIVPSNAMWFETLTNYAPDLTSPANPFTQQTIAYAKTQLIAAGLSGSNPAQQPTINVQYNSLQANPNTVDVSIQPGSLPLFGNGAWLPSWIVIQDSAQGVARYACIRSGFEIAPKGNPFTPMSPNGPCYGLLPSSPLANPQNSMVLRPFNQTPTTITMGVPSSGNLWEFMQMPSARTYYLNNVPF